MIDWGHAVGSVFLFEYTTGRDAQIPIAVTIFDDNTSDDTNANAGLVIIVVMLATRFRLRVFDPRWVYISVAKSLHPGALVGG